MLWISAGCRGAPKRARRPDPYRVWLSEVMLQQTTVAAVKPYFETFTARWPTVEALAAAEDGEVMARLGRARLLCPRPQPARLRPDGGGRAWRRASPTTRRRCASCPGIGAYTAAAIAAIAFGRRAVVVDGNVERVIARLHAVEEPLPGSAAANPRADRRDDPGRGRRRFRPGDDGSGRDDLHAAQSRLRPLPAVGACARPMREGDPGALSGQGAQGGRGRTARASPTGSSMTAQVLLVRRPAKGLLGGMLALPEADRPPRPTGRRPARSSMSSPISR